MSATDALQFAQLPTALLLDDRTVGISDAAWRLYTTGLMKAAAFSAHEGVLWVDAPRAVDRWACLEGGAAAVPGAVEELLAAGLWREGAEPGRVVVAGFAERHDAAVAKRKRGSRGAHERHHVRGGKRSATCAYCVEEAPAPAPAPAAPDAAAVSGVEVLVAELDTMTERDASVDAYAQIAGALPELAGPLGVTEKAARQAVIVHACRTWGIEVEGRTIGRVSSLANRHGIDPALRALAHAATAAKGDPIAYASKLLANAGGSR